MQQVRERTEGFVSGAWLSLENYRDPDVARFVSQVVPVVVAGQRTVAQLTASYLALMVAAYTGGKTLVEAVDYAAVTGAAVRGVDMAVEYRRPAVTLYTALSEGKSMTDAVKAGLKRASDLSVMDVQLAKTHTVAGAKQIAFYRRTLSGLENCELCAVASTNKYRRGDLMPIHGRCDCGITPVFRTTPKPEPVASDRAVAVRQHGELGPVLTWADQSFTGPDDLH